MALADTLTTTVTGFPPITDTRLSGESTSDFIDRHCRHVWNVTHGTGVTMLKCAELDVTTTKQEGQTEEQFYAAYCAALQAAA